MANEAVFIMLLPLRRRFITELKEAREDKAILCLEARALPHDVHWPTTQPSHPPYLSEPALGEAADADLVSQLLVCVPFVAESTWLGFPLRSSLIYPCLLNSAF